MVFTLGPGKSSNFSVETRRVGAATSSKVPETPIERSPEPNTQR